MAGHSRGQRPQPSSNDPQKPTAASRIVRVARPANDNNHRSRLPHAVFLALASALALLAILNWTLI